MLLHINTFSVNKNWVSNLYIQKKLREFSYISNNFCVYLDVKPTIKPYNTKQVELRMCKYEIFD